MRKKDDFDRVWDIIEQVSVCMLTTQFVGGLRARPLEARPDRYDQIKATWRKTDEVWWPGGPNDPDVCLLRIEPPRNCGMDRRALSLLPSSSPRRGQPGRRRSSARTER
jgi:hypothetical protein